MLKKLRLLVLCIFAVPKSTFSMEFGNKEYGKSLQNTVTTLAFPSIDIISYCYSLKAAKKLLTQNPEAFHEACETNNVEPLPLYLAVGACVNARDSNGQIPLHRAVSHNHKKIVEFLLNHGSCVNVADNSGYTPLHGAVSKNNKELTELLLHYGASVGAQIKRGWTTATFMSHPEDQRIDHAANAHGISRRHSFGSKNYDEHIRTDGWTPLHRAAAYGYKDMVELLLSKTFFPPTTALSSSTSPLTLQKLCLKVLFKSVDDFDEGSFRNHIVPFTAQYLAIGPTHDNTIFQMVIDHAPLKLQREIVRYWKLHTADENEKKIKLLLEMHLKRHFDHLKDVVAIKNGQHQTADEMLASSKSDAFLNVAKSFDIEIERLVSTCMKNQSENDIGKLLKHVASIQTCNDLDPQLQLAIKHTIEGKLGID